MKLEDLNKRINQLLELADAVYATISVIDAQRVGNVFMQGSVSINSEMFQELRSACLSFIGRVFGADHTFFQEFDSNARVASPVSVTTARGILKAIKQEIEGGWLFTVRGIVAAEIFTDFLEMANHLLQEGYKDPAAVMIGGVLEEHLRQLCTKNNIPVTSISPRDGKEMPKTSDRMNNELAGAGVYNKLYQKNVTSWLDLRNKAAHGHYSEYDVRQVELMEASVLDFIAKTGD